jgi:IS5 family transposase
MREKVQQQPSLMATPIDHVHAHELRRMSTVLDELADATAKVHADLVPAGTQANKGRKGMTAEQVLRAMLLKQMNGYSYEELAFHLADSGCYRWFCRIGIGDDAPDRATLQRNIKAVRVETTEAINRMLVRYAAEHGIENGATVRVDCTVVESNIHHPTDSSLLWDCVRVLGRLLASTREQFGIAFHDHRRRAKRRALGILSAKSFEKRIPLYRDLLKISDKTVREAERVAVLLDAVRRDAPTSIRRLEATAACEQLRHYIPLAHQIIAQTERRVLRGESVPSTDKLVSIFEPHTDIIVKDNRDTYYGHKICLTSGTSGLVTDVVVQTGNPADSTLAVAMMKRHRKLYGRAPQQAAFDGGFASKENVADIKALGVKDVAFSKRCGLTITEMVRNSWVFRKLRDFRAGIEGTISFLKRVFGLGRCTWRGYASFKAYVCGSVLACNLLIVARHLLAA